MINRVLIRIKVVQMLYCYLLTQNEFKIESAPETASRDKRFAYSMYLDLLVMLLRLSGYKLTNNDVAIAGVGDNKYLRANKIIRALYADAEVKSIVINKAAEFRLFTNATAAIYSEITKSAIYRSYIHLKQADIKDDITFWVTIINTVIAKNTELLAAAREKEGFTMVGYEQGINMLANTLKSFGDTRTIFIDAKNSLARSLDKAYELYHWLLLLPVELTQLQDQRLDAAKNKYLPTDEDLNPNMRFVENRLVRAISESPEMEAYLKEMPISWNENPTLLRSLLDKVLQSDIYVKYMESEKSGLNEDCDFWRAIFKHIILPSEEIADMLESKSVYWNDDIEIVGTFVLKTIKRVATSANGTLSLLPKYKDEEDARFGAELFVNTVEHFEEYRSYIDRFIDAKQWDPERLAFMDVIIMAVAISELLEYPAIPIPVTLNEYIEIANNYSTMRSGQFVNGMLFSIINYLKSEGKLTKN